MNKVKVKGLIWYCGEFYSGTEEDYEAFCIHHENTSLILTYPSIDLKDLRQLSENLNHSNARKLLVK